MHTAAVPWRARGHTYTVVCVCVCKRCELPVQEPRCDLRLEQVRSSYSWRGVVISDGGRAIGRAKKEGTNSYGGFSTVSTVSPPSRRARETVERGCSCTWHSTCSTSGLSAQACECRNAGRQCTGCYCWGRCKNWVRLFPSPTTTPGLLGHFPRGADPPATDRRATTPSVRPPTSLSLWAILAAGSRGRGAWARASGRRAIRKVGRGGAGGDDSEGWSRESGSNNMTSDAESEESEEKSVPLTASPRGTQESGASGLRMGARAGGSGGGKATYRTADGGETRSRHGAGKQHGGEKGGRRGW